MAIICSNCNNYYANKNINTCINCLSPHLYSLDPYGCKLCTKPTDYEYCWSCNNKFNEGNFRLTDLIPISYNTKKDDLTFLIKGYKDYGCKDRIQGIVTVLYTFLYYNFKKITSHHKGIDYVTYMPSYNNRNHCEVFLRNACNINGLQIQVSNLLRQTSPMPKHQGTGMNNRILYKDSFEVINHSVKGKTILLFDDIFTTGSTISSAAHSLFKAGALKVIGLVLARVISGSEVNRAEELKSHNPFNFNLCKYDYENYK